MNTVRYVPTANERLLDGVVSRGSEEWDEVSQCIVAAAVPEASQQNRDELPAAYKRLRALITPRRDCDDMTRLRAATAYGLRSIFTAWAHEERLTQEIFDTAYRDIGWEVEMESLRQGVDFSGYFKQDTILNPGTFQAVNVELSALLIAATMARHKDPDLLMMPSFAPSPSSWRAAEAAHIPQLQALYVSNGATHSLPIHVHSRTVHTISSRRIKAGEAEINLAHVLRSQTNRGTVINPEGVYRGTAAMRSLLAQCVVQESAGLPLPDHELEFLDAISHGLRERCERIIYDKSAPAGPVGQQDPEPS